MDTQYVRLLLVHGSIVLLVGLVVGVPFWVAIIRKMHGDTIRAWRVAHTTLISCGLIMLAAGALSPNIVLSPALQSTFMWALVVSGYGFVFALVLGAATGQRALIPKPIGFNTLLFVGHLVGAVGAILGVGVLLYGLM